jgi:hypothetical protein
MEEPVDPIQVLPLSRHDKRAMSNIDMFQVDSSVYFTHLLYTVH